MTLTPITLILLTAVVIASLLVFKVLKNRLKPEGLSEWFSITALALSIFSLGASLSLILTPGSSVIVFSIVLLSLLFFSMGCAFYSFGRAERFTSIGACFLLTALIFAILTYATFVGKLPMVYHF